MEKTIQSIKAEMKKLEEALERKEITEDTFQLRYRNLETELNEVKRKGQEIPTFCKVIAIIDLIICILRIPLALLSVAGYMVLKSQGTENALLVTVPFEIITGFLLGILGLAANISILMRKPIGVPIGYLNVIVTIGSIFVGIWQASVQMPSGGEAAAFMVGAAFGIIIRLVLLGLYVKALVDFSNWYESSQKSQFEVAKAFD